jgi:hypothetical protein
MLERKTKTDATDSDRVKMEGESNELMADGVPDIGMLVDQLVWLGVGLPSLVDPTVGLRNDVLYVSSGPGSNVEVTDGVYSNKLELIDCCGLAA